MRRGVTLAGVVGAVLAVGWAVSAAPESGSDSIPAAFAPFEHMVGGWKGTGVPKANPLKGWQEKHMWAWKFVKGNPVGMTIEFTGDKAVTKGQLMYDAEAEKYRLDGTDAAGKPVVYSGAMDAAGKFLTMDRVDTGAGPAKERLRFRILENKIRYMMWQERKEAGSPQFAPVIEVGMTKEGEAFAAGGSAADLPKCIITGGSATMSVTYEGKSYALCCTGCRDEFNDNPAKYVKKALMREQAAGKTTKASETKTLAKDDGSFEGLVDDTKPKAEMKPKAKAKAKPEPKAGRPAAKPKAEPAEEDEPAEPAPTKPKAGGDAAKAASILRQAQALDKLGKAEAALGYYRKIVAEHPDTPAAKVAAARIKALGKE